MDIDNVIAHTDKVFRSLIRSETNGLVCLEYEDITRFNYYECKDARGNGISKEQWHPIHDKFSTAEVIETIEPVTEAVRTLADLARDMDIVIVTSRLEQAKEPTRHWLRKHEIPFDNLRFSQHRQKHAESDAFFSVIEDDYDQALAFTHKGIPCLLIRHPWNQKRERIPGIDWVSSWPECAALLRSRLTK